MGWFQTLKADKYDLSYDRSHQSSSLRCALPQGLACLLPLGFLAICIWVARLKDLRGNWKFMLVGSYQGVEKSMGGTENSRVTHTQCQWKNYVGLNMFLCKCGWTQPHIGDTNMCKNRVLLGVYLLCFVSLVNILYDVFGSNLWEISLESEHEQLETVMFRTALMPSAPCAHLRLEHEANHQVDLLIPSFPWRLKI